MADSKHTFPENNTNLAAAFHARVTDLLEKVNATIADIESKPSTDLSSNKSIENNFSDLGDFDAISKAYFAASKKAILEHSAEETDVIEMKLRDLQTKLATLTELLNTKALDLKDSKLFLQARKNITDIRVQLSSISQLYYNPPTLAAVGVANPADEKKLEDKKSTHTSLFWTSRKKDGAADEKIKTLSAGESKTIVDNFVAQITRLRGELKTIIDNTTNSNSDYKKYNPVKTKSPDPMLQDMTKLFLHMQEMGNPGVKPTFGNTLQAYEMSFQHKRLALTPEQLTTVNAHLELLKKDAGTLKSLYTMDYQQPLNKHLYSSLDTDISAEIYGMIRDITDRLAKFTVAATAEAGAAGLKSSLRGSQ